MKIIITGRNIELTEGLKNAVEDKLNKLEQDIRSFITYAENDVNEDDKELEQQVKIQYTI